MVKGGSKVRCSDRPAGVDNCDQLYCCTACTKLGQWEATKNEMPLQVLGTTQAPQP
jgi:hypothetical protein